MNAYPAKAIINQNDRRRKLVVFSENGRRYEYVNTGENKIIMLHIDGGLFPKNDVPLRCDYAFETEIENEPKTCLVELKGHDIPHACLQLKETLLYFESHYPVKEFYCRLVTSGNKKPNRESVQEKELNAYLLRNGYQRLKMRTTVIKEKTEDFV